MSTKVKATPIGIDLGTTYSCVVAWFDQHDRVEIFPNEQGNTITPSCVAFNDTEHLVGEGANSAGFWVSEIRILLWATNSKGPHF
ncbi:putative Heat shock protein 70 family [Helianthus anomalus]